MKKIYFFSILYIFHIKIYIYFKPFHFSFFNNFYKKMDFILYLMGKCVFLCIKVGENGANFHFYQKILPNKQKLNLILWHHLKERELILSTTKVE